MALHPQRAASSGMCERCDCCRARPVQPSSPTTRFWLPHPGRFAQIALDLDHARGWFALLCFRRDDHGALGTGNALPNRYRLRELEATLLDLNIELPPFLRRYLIAMLGGDDEEQRALRPRIRNLLCCAGAARTRVECDAGEGIAPAALRERRDPQRPCLV